MGRPEIVLVYDKECPVCDNYCQLIRIKESQGELNIVNARDDSEIMTEITQRGLDIDRGMVLKIDDQIYYGAEAIHRLALMSTHSGIFNRLNYWIFKSGTLSRVLYPILKFFRNLLLKILGKTRINNLGMTGNDKF